MNGYDLSSRSRMLKRGRYCLMKPCSVSSASASLPTTTHSIRSVLATISSWPGEFVPRPPTCALAKCEATRLRIDFALPT